MRISDWSSDVCSSDLGYRAQLRPHHPVRKGTQVGWRPFAPVRLARSRLGLDGEHEDLAEPCRDRPHLGLDAFGKLAFHLLNAFVDELAREIDVGSVLKHDGHLAEAIARNRAGVVEVRDTRDGSLDGEGDALLGLEWRIAFGLGVYLHLHIGDVRHGINRQTKSAPDTKGAEQAHYCEDKPALADR